jgi:DNA (cytosine-5)-methyltransferase 1
VICERTVEFGTGYLRGRSGLYMPAEHVPASRPIAVDLFAGAGGFSVGFHQAGWHVAAAVEADLAAMMTYLANLGSPATIVHQVVDGAWTANTAAKCAPGLTGKGWIANQPDQLPVEHVYLGDIRTLDGRAILADLGVAPGEVGAVIGGPPCQGFSTAGWQNVIDPRNSLVFEFCRIVLDLAPKTFVMENVPAMTRMVTAEGIPVLDAIALYLSRGGYADYEALKRSLSFDPTARDGIRTTETVKREPQLRGAGPEQPDLFGGTRRDECHRGQRSRDHGGDRVGPGGRATRPRAPRHARYAQADGRPRRARRTHRRDDQRQEAAAINRAVLAGSSGRSGTSG